MILASPPKNLKAHCVHRGVFAIWEPVDDPTVTSYIVSFDGFTPKSITVPAEARHAFWGLDAREVEPRAVSISAVNPAGVGPSNTVTL